MQPQVDLRAALPFFPEPAPTSTASGTLSMNPNKACGKKAISTRLAATCAKSGDELVESLGVTEGMELLALGGGDGTTHRLPEAQRGAPCSEVDIAGNLVAAGNARAAEAGLTNIRFQEGDASNLEGLRTGRSTSSSAFSAQCSRPRPFDVAKEMVA